MERVRREAELELEAREGQVEALEQSVQEMSDQSLFTLHLIPRTEFLIPDCSTSSGRIILPEGASQGESA